MMYETTIIMFIVEVGATAKFITYKELYGRLNWQQFVPTSVGSFHLIRVTLFRRLLHRVTTTMFWVSLGITTVHKHVNYY